MQLLQLVLADTVIASDAGDSSSSSSSDDVKAYEIDEEDVTKQN